MKIDIDAVRADTPGTRRKAHLNNAGCSMSPEPVVDAVVDYLRAESLEGGYRLRTARQEAVEDHKEAAAELLDCSASEIAFAPSATSAWWSAFNAVKLEAGDRVLATTAEYSSNVFGLIQLRRRGVEVELLPVDPATGQTSLESLAELMDERVKLVCATQVPTEGGLLNPVREIGELVAPWPAYYLVDAAQSVGQMPVSVAQIDCDFLAVTGRKFLRAPRGTGLLFVRNGLRGLGDPLALDLRSARWTDAWNYELPPTAVRFETFEASIAAKVGLGVALRYALRLGMENIEDRIAVLAGELRQALAGLDGVELRELGGPQTGIVTFTVNGHEPASLSAHLAAHDVTVSAVPATHLAFDQTSRGAEGLVRASVHYYNTSAELERLTQLLADL